MNDPVIVREHVRLTDENDRLRKLLIELLRIVKAVEINLQRALDKDHEKDDIEYDETRRWT